MAGPSPGGVDRLYDPLKTEAVWAHAKWQIWRGLYGNRGRIEILKDSAAGFFSILQGTLFDDVLMAISRLTDPRGSGERENLTLDHLSEYLGNAGLRAAQTEFDAILARLRADCTAIRELRNKVLSHRDLAATLTGGSTLSTIRAREVDVALGHLAEGLNVFERAAGKAVWMYKDFIHTESYNRLLAQLKKGLAYDAHVRSGVISKGTDDLTLPALDA
jgi:HEPN superfamily AbiU2-like protein